MHRICVGIGGNVGDTAQTIEHAIPLLTDRIGPIVDLSSNFTTRPMGRSAGESFLNAAATFDTSLPPRQVLDELHVVEEQCGRKRTTRWGPRTLDLDLLLYGDVVLDEPDIVVPHPAMWFRAFVTNPLAEIAPATIHPIFRKSIQELRQRLRRRPLVFAVDSRQFSQNSISTVQDIAESVSPGDAVAIRDISDQSNPTESNGVFARLIVNKTSPIPAKPRTQPAQESEFVIRIPEDRIAESFQEILAAVGA